MLAAGKVVLPAQKVGDKTPIYTISDIHYGNAGCWLKGLRDDVQLIKSQPLARVLLVGDLGEFIGPADKRWDPATVTPNARVTALKDWGRYLADGVVAELDPIRDRILGAVCGNHEASYDARHAQQMHDYICTQLGCPHWGYSCLVDLVFKRPKAKASRAYRTFLHHGAGSAQTRGGKINRLERFMDSFDADLYICGHVHDKMVTTLDVVGANRTCSELVNRRKLGVYSGTYLRTYSQGHHAGYGERRGYRPTPLGCNCITFQPFDKDWGHRADSMVAEVRAG